VGLATAAVPLGLATISIQFLEPWRFAVAAACWVGIVLFLAILTLVDLKHYLIPDEATIAIAVLGIISAIVTAPAFTESTGSFLGSYAMLAGFRSSFMLAHLVGLLAGGGILLLLYGVTRGRGIGFGDVKLAFALGLAFAWPDSVVLVGLAFVLGSIAAVPALLARRAGLKTALPFGPFLALSAVLLLAFGSVLTKAYLSLALLTF
jgi:leader peptidase (prepilin peptidase)/N-methyltransferase